jgi:hypothetical protein
MSSPLVESFVIFQQYSSLSRLFPSEFRFVFVKSGLINVGEQRARQCTELAESSETPQERSNHLCRK